MQWWHLEAGLEPEFLNDACILQHTKTHVSVAVRPISFLFGFESATADISNACMQPASSRIPTLRAASLPACSDLAPVTTCASMHTTIRSTGQCCLPLHYYHPPDASSIHPSTVALHLTILPDAKMSAVVLGSRMRMMTAANRYTGEWFISVRAGCWVVVPRTC